MILRPLSGVAAARHLAEDSMAAIAAHVRLGAKKELVTSFFLINRRG